MFPSRKVQCVTKTESPRNPLNILNSPTPATWIFFIHGYMMRSPDSELSSWSSSSCSSSRSSWSSSSSSRCCWTNSCNGSCCCCCCWFCWIIWWWTTLGGDDSLSWCETTTTDVGLKSPLLARIFVAWGTLFALSPGRIVAVCCWGCIPHWGGCWRVGGCCASGGSGIAAGGWWCGWMVLWWGCGGGGIWWW